MIYTYAKVEELQRAVLENKVAFVLFDYRTNDINELINIYGQQLLASGVNTSKLVIPKLVSKKNHTYDIVFMQRANTSFSRTELENIAQFINNAQNCMYLRDYLRQASLSARYMEKKCSRQ